LNVGFDRRTAMREGVRESVKDEGAVFGMRDFEHAGSVMMAGRIGFSCALLSTGLFLVKGLTVAVFHVPVSIPTTVLVMLLLLLASRCNDILRTGRGLFCLRACSVAGGLGPLLFLISGFNPVFIPLTALGIASLTLLWGRFLSLQSHQALLVITATAFTVLGAFLMLALDLGLVFIVPLITASALLSSLCDALTGREAVADGHGVSRALSRSRSILGRGNWSTIVALGLVLGIVMVMAGTIDYEQRLTASVFGGTIVLASLVTMLLRVRFRTVYEDVARRTLALFVTGALLPYPFLAVEGKMACICVLLFSITVNTIILLDAIAETSRLRMISPYWIMGREGALFLFGMAIALSGFWYCLVEEPSEWHVVAACISSATVLVLMQVFIENQTYPFFDAEPSDEAGANGLASHQAVPLSTKGGSIWKRKIEAVADGKGLSPRQREVMRLLAKGRDVKYIMNHFVISRATAKTHVYNLYRKLGIHSRQELLNLIEQASPKEQ
jgi:DNA-binding CsgD family transcriptional regulator